MRGVAAILVFLFASSAFAGEQPRGRHWVRRLTLAAACAASFWDAHSTAVAVRAGARETNPIFADGLGRPRWGRILGFKAGACAASIVIQERFDRRPNSDRFWTGINTGAAGLFSAAAIRNLKVASEPAR